MNAVLRWLRSRPLTVGIALALVVVWLVAVALQRNGTLLSSVAGVTPDAIRDQRWWSLATSLFVAGSALEFVLAIAATIVGIGWAERVIGWRRSLLAFLVTGIVAGLLGVGLQLLGQAFHEYWSSAVSGVVSVDPLSPIAGTVAWATASAPPLWRRRVRVILIGTSLALLLYSGRPADLYLVFAVLLGWLLGRIGHPAANVASSRHEQRGLLALVTALFAIGPVLTLLSASRYGVLAPLGLALADPRLTAGAHHATCVVGHIVAGCAGEVTAERLTGIGPTLTSLLPLALMLVSARGLLAGRRLAVWMLAVLLGSEAAVSAFYFGFLPVFGSRWELPLAPQHYWELSLWMLVSTLVPLGLAVVLLWTQRMFPLVPSRRRVVGFLVALVAAVVVPAVIFVVGGLIVPGQFRPTATVWTLLPELPERIIPASFLRHEKPTLVTHGFVAHTLAHGVGPLFWIAVIVAAVFALRGRGGSPVEADDAARIRELLDQGSDTLGYMATWAGNRLLIRIRQKFGTDIIQIKVVS